MVTLALPELQDDLGASTVDLQWVMNAYLLTIAVLTVTAGRLGDMFGSASCSCAGWAHSPPAPCRRRSRGVRRRRSPAASPRVSAARRLLPLSIALVAADVPRAEQPRDAREQHGFVYSLAGASWVLVGVAAVGVVLTWVFVNGTTNPIQGCDP